MTIGSLSLWIAVGLIIGINTRITVKSAIAAILYSIGVYTLVLSGWWMNESREHKDQAEEEAVK
jgi:uncharacterized membrane protein (Fun14 family)